MVRDLIGMGKLMKIKSFYIEFTNPGAATAANFQYYQLFNETAIIFCNLDVPIPIASVVLCSGYIGASTIEIEPNIWTIALPDLLLTDNFSFALWPNGGTAELTMLYEVYDA